MLLHDKWWSNLCLSIDDVEDESILRRGVPVAHKIYGQAQTINCANYVYFLALKELQNIQRPGIVNIYTEEMLNLHRGQGADIYWRDSGICPSEDEYLRMISNSM
jgi:geranylgeranyl diphosphate synthase type 3